MDEDGFDGNFDRLVGELEESLRGLESCSNEDPESTHYEIDSNCEEALRAIASGLLSREESETVANIVVKMLELPLTRWYA